MGHAAPLESSNHRELRWNSWDGRPTVRRARAREGEQPARIEHVAISVDEVVARLRHEVVRPPLLALVPPQQLIRRVEVRVLQVQVTAQALGQPGAAMVLTRQALAL